MAEEDVKVDAITSGAEDVKVEALTSGAEVSDKVEPSTTLTLLQEDYWRESINSWPDFWKCTLERNIGVDVILKVGPAKEEIPCHKVILMAHSPVFECKFTRWRSISQRDTGSIDEVELLDDDPDTFKIMLKFLYFAHLGSKPIETDKLLDVIVLARKYVMPFVIKKAKTMLTNKGICTAKNCLNLYQIAKLLREEDLEHYFEEQIALRAFHIFTGDTVNLFTKENLTHFVKKDNLNANESAIYNGCVRWAKNQCHIQNLDASGENLRKILGDVLDHIRFPILNEKLLLFSVKKEDILTEGELFKIIYYKKCKSQNASKQDKDSLDEGSVEFPYKTTPRIRCLSLERYRKRKDDSNEVDFQHLTTIPFEVDRAIYIIGFGFFGGKKDCSFNVKIGIKSSLQEQEYGKDKMSEFHKDVKYQADSTDASKNVFAVYFTEPVFVGPKCRRYICFTLEGAKTYHSPSMQTNYALKTYHGKVNFTFYKTSPKTHNGQMPFLYYRFATENELR